jgi:mannose-6-phosphate isomerase-like protein (cupin superfamily)
VSEPEQGIILGPGEGRELLSPSGLAQRLKAGSADTGGAYSLWESVTLPGEGPLPHIHHNHEEAFYILDGELEMRLGQRTLTVMAGAFILVPRGTVHGFFNHGKHPVHLLTIFSPPMDRYRAALTDLVLALPDRSSRRPIDLDPAVVAELQRQHGIRDELVPPTRE